MNKFNNFIVEQYCKSLNYGYRHANLCLFVFGVFILTYGLTKFSYAAGATGQAEEIIKGNWGRSLKGIGVVSKLLTFGRGWTSRTSPSLKKGWVSPCGGAYSDVRSKMG